MVPEALDELTGEVRHRVYRILSLQVFVYPDGDLDVRGVLREAVCTPTDTRRPSRNRHSRAEGEKRVSPQHPQRGSLKADKRGR